MHLFYTPDIASDSYTLDPDQSRHAVGVLRLRAGQSIALTDGRGTLLEAVIDQAMPKSCSVHITARHTNYGQRPYHLTVAVAPTKNIDRYEWFLEKATEIGIDRIVPVLCDHSERKVVKHERSQAVILSAVKQSLKAYVPTLDELTPLDTLIKSLPASPDTTRFIAHCDPANEKVELASVIGTTPRAVVLIGPEGDFSPEEVVAAHAAGFRSVSLGPSRLRTETAAVMATAMAAIAAITATDTTNEQ